MKGRKGGGAADVAPHPAPRPLVVAYLWCSHATKTAHTHTSIVLKSDDRMSKRSGFTRVQGPKEGKQITRRSREKTNRNQSHRKPDRNHRKSLHFSTGACTSVLVLGTKAFILDEDGIALLLDEVDAEEHHETPFLRACSIAYKITII